MGNKRGFTLVEVLIAMAVTALIMTAAYTAFDSQQKTTTIQTNVSDMQQNLRAALDFMARDIRLAGCNPGKHDLNSAPEVFGILDIGFKDITTAMSQDADYKSIDPANYAGSGVSYIRISWDKNENGQVDSANEIVDYSLVDGATITPGVRDLFMRFPEGGNTKDVLASNIIALGLAYAYDNNDNGELEQDGGNIRWVVAPSGATGNWQSLNEATGALTDLGPGNAVDLNNIRAVKVWLLAEAEAPDRDYNDTNTYIVGPHIVTPANYNADRRHRLLEREIFCRNLGLEVLTQ